MLDSYIDVIKKWDRSLQSFYKAQKGPFLQFPHFTMMHDWSIKNSDFCIEVCIDYFGMYFQTWWCYQEKRYVQVVTKLK